MLRVLQAEIRKGDRCSMELTHGATQLVVSSTVLGSGGYGHVYKGSWQRRPAAVKVMNVRASDGEAVSDAMEMAVLLTLKHPNVRGAAHAGADGAVRAHAPPMLPASPLSSHARRPSRPSPGHTPCRS
jgi:hypothetical protein